MIKNSTPMTSVEGFRSSASLKQANPKKVDPEKTPYLPTSAKRLDRVSLSGGSDFAVGVGVQPEVYDAQKINKIKDAIREGRYKINAGDIADKILEQNGFDDKKAKSK